MRYKVTKLPPGRPKGAGRKRQHIGRARRRSIAHTGGYNEALVWLRGR